MNITIITCGMGTFGSPSGIVVRGMVLGDDQNRTGAIIVDRAWFTDITDTAAFADIVDVADFN